MKKTLLVVAILGLAGCAGSNPNPGERTVDVAWSNYDYDTAFEILKPAAEKGEPWAQLRMGVAFELGSGVEKNIPTAIKWYELAAEQEVEGEWADGQLVGVEGKPGYFNQNTDALIAKFQLANIYLAGDGIQTDHHKALQLAEYVAQKSQGNSLFYCCEHLDGRYISSDAIADTLRQARAAAAE